MEAERHWTLPKKVLNEMFGHFCRIQCGRSHQRQTLIQSLLTDAILALNSLIECNYSYGAITVPGVSGLINVDVKI